MAEKLIVEKVYENDDIPVGDCQIYTISSPSDDIPICSVESEGLAHAFAAAQLMLEALERMIKYIEAGAGATAEIEYGAVLNQARAAIAAAKGE
jgi:hypothetical protein